MSRLPRRPAVVFLAAVLLIAAATGCKDGAQQMALPEDLTALLPADASVLVIVPSLDAWREQRQALADSSDGRPGLPRELLETFDLRAKLATEISDFPTVVDPAQPVAIAVKTPSMGEKPKATVIFARLDRDATDLPLTGGQVVKLNRGAYTAFSSDPAYVPADSLPNIARDLMPGLMTVRVDLAGIIAIYRPMAEIGLGALAMTPPPDPDAEGPQDSLTPAEAAGLVKILRAIMDSADQLDFAFDLADQQLQLGGRFTVKPGSPLEAGPQPDMAHALALTALLPAAADLHMAVAVDQARQMAVFRDFYLAGMTKSFGTDPQMEAAFTDWFAGYLDGYELLAVPMAVSETFNDTGVHVHAVLAPDDPAWVLSWAAGQLEALNALDLGVTFGARETVTLAGIDVNQWPATIATETVDMPAPPGESVLQKQLWSALFLSDTPMIRLAVVEGLLVVTTDHDDEALSALIRRTTAGDAKPHAELERLAAVAGPGCREVLTGDLAGALAWVGRTYGLDTASSTRPMPVKMVLSQDGPRYGFGLSMDVPGLFAGVETLSAMADEME